MRIVVTGNDFTYNLENGTTSSLKAGKYYLVVEADDTYYRVFVPDRKEPVFVRKDRCIVEGQEPTKRPESDHYHTGSVDVWQFADENFSQLELEGFHRINAIKYLTRYGKKNGYNRKDLEKAIVSIQKLIEIGEKHADN